VDRSQPRGSARRRGGFRGACTGSSSGMWRSGSSRLGPGKRR
jgi:hypothetical protein